MTETVGGKVARAGLQSVAGRLGGRAIDFATLLVLAQLLVPADFGLIALAMTVILLVEAVTDLPINQPILRAEDPTPDYYDTAFTLGLMRALVLASVVAAAAAPVAAFYKEPRLPLLILALATAPMLRSLVSPRMADFTRVYNMWPDFILTLSGKAVSFTVVATLAVTTQSYWAIAAGTITTPLVGNVLSYWLAPYRPRLRLTRWHVFRDIVGWSSVGQFFSALNFQIDRILLGRTLPAADLGRYALASDLTGVAMQGILVPFSGPLTVALAQADKTEDLRRAWDKTLNATVCIMGPVLLALAVMTDPTVDLLLGPSWSNLSPILSWLALTTIPAIVGPILAPLANALFRPRLNAERAIVEFAVKVPLMVVGIAMFGLWGAIAARGVTSLAGMLFSLSGAATLTGTRLVDQLWSLRRTSVGLLTFAGICFWMCPDHGQGSGRLVLGVQLASVFGLALAGQWLSMFAFWFLAGRPSDTIEATGYRRLSNRR
ncbi:MAG: oligosaccharide flippase family protein [Flavimaricola sp.]|nr:oligosaccharide flippase family protein [Flavimaricola sp.]